jgi:hypothetical protein
MRAMANSQLLTQSVVTAFEGFNDLASEALSRYNITPSTEWTPIDDVISSMGFVEEKIGKNTTRKIGRNISRFTEKHTKVTSVTDMFETINHLYSSNHQHLSRCIQLGREKDGYRIDFQGNPYPFSFNWGLIEGFMLQFQIPYMIEVSEKENLLYVINPLKNS